MHHTQRQPVDHRIWVAPIIVLLMFATAAAPPAGPPPPQEINLRQLGLQLYSHSSFAFEIENEDPDMRLHFGGHWTASPFSWHVENRLAKAMELAYTVIGDRDWVTLTSGEVLTCAGWEEAPKDNPLYQACDLGTQSLGIVHTASKSFFADVPARYTGKQVVVDGVPCYVYSVPDVDNGGEGHWYLAVDTGLPVRFEITTIVWRFYNVDDPDNMIPAPVSDMPAQLHVDDARMALNGLSTFRYVSQLVFRTTTVSTYTVTGIYQLAGPTWLAAVRGCDTCQPVEFLSAGGRFWQRPTSAAPWVAVASDSEDATFATLGNPFYAWPGAGTPRLANPLPGATRTVNDTECQLYGYQWTGPAKDGGDATSQWQLCVTEDTSLPMAAGYSVHSASTGMDVVTILTNLDDPLNVVPLPPQ